MNPKVFLNDGTVDITEAKISIADAGFLYSAGLFETMRCNNGKVFKLNEHLDRLFASCEKLSINNTYDRKTIEKAVYETIQVNELKDARLRLTLTSGSARPGDDKLTSTLLITAVKLKDYSDEFYEKGVLAVLCPYRLNASDPVTGHKTLNYYSNMLGLDLARKRNAAEAIWFTHEGKLAEGSITNVFLVKDSKLLTPSVDTPVLPGVARKTVIEKAKENDIQVEEKDLIIDDLLNADEVFITNVIMKVMPVVQVEKHVVNDGKVGEVTEKMISIFDEELKKQCGEKNEG